MAVFTLDRRQFEKYIGSMGNTNECCVYFNWMNSI